MAKPSPTKEVRDLVPITASAPRKEKMAICENCVYWAQLNIQGTLTAFGTCERWNALFVEDRGGVQATPFRPVTPSGASCGAFELP